MLCLHVPTPLLGCHNMFKKKWRLPWFGRMVKPKLRLKIKTCRRLARAENKLIQFFQLNSKRFQQGSRAVPVFRGVHFRVTSPRPQRYPTHSLMGTRMDGDAVPDIKAILLFAFICVLRMFRKKVDMINMHAPILATNNGLHDARRHRIQHHNRNNWKAVRGYNN